MKSCERLAIVGMCSLELVALAACGVRDGWTKPDGSDQDRKAALYECERDAKIAEGGPAMFRRCMDAKGYTQQKP